MLPKIIAHKLKNLRVNTPKNNPGPKWKGVKGIFIQSGGLKEKESLLEESKNLSKE